MILTTIIALFLSTSIHAAPVSTIGGTCRFQARCVSSKSRSSKSSGPSSPPPNYQSLPSRYDFQRVNSGDYRSTATELHQASRWLSGDEVEAVAGKHHGRYLNDQENGLGLSPAHEAVNCGNLEALKRLVEMGADVNVQCDFGDSLLHGIGSNSDRMREIARYLIEQGASMELRNRNGETPLMQHAPYPYMEWAVRLLLENGADPNADNIRGDTSLHYAVEAGARNNVDLLLKAGADPTIRNMYGQSVEELI